VNFAGKDVGVVLRLDKEYGTQEERVDTVLEASCVLSLSRTRYLLPGVIDS
jgi:hypothetical protein